VTVRVLADGQTDRQTDTHTHTQTHPPSHTLTHTHTHTHTDANRFYNLSHAICYSYGTDKNRIITDAHQQRSIEIRIPEI